MKPPVIRSVTTLLEVFDIASVAGVLSRTRL